MNLNRYKAAALAAAIVLFGLSDAARAKPAPQPADENRICILLELAHESSCAEYELVPVRRNPISPEFSLGEDDVPGSIRQDGTAPATHSVER